MNKFSKALLQCLLEICCVLPRPASPIPVPLQAFQSLIPPKPPSHQCWDGGMRGAFESAAPLRRAERLTKSCMQTPAPTPGKTRRVMHANATLPPLPPAPRIAPTCAPVRFFLRFFSHCKFSCKKTRSKIAKIANLGFLAPRKGRKKT